MLKYLSCNAKRHCGVLWGRKKTVKYLVTLSQESSQQLKLLDSYVGFNKWNCVTVFVKVFK